jgi:branched-chain amino acid transport system ATP-binding protein
MTLAVAVPAADPGIARPDVLRVEQLEVVYNHVQLAVQGLSMRVREGEIVAVLGTNGAGKTTMLRAITGFLPGDNAQIADGRVLYGGADITRLRPHVLAQRGVVIVPERDKIFTTLTVAENLAVVPVRTSAGDRRRVAELVATLFPVLEQRKRQLAGYLSGGERQMLAIGKALLLNPRLLLIDELSFGLGPMVVERLMSTLREIHERDGIAMVIVEQNAAAALAVADYAYVLENGRVVLDGPSDRVRGHEDIQEFYLGGSTAAGDEGFANLKQYKRKRRWWG